MAKWFTRYYKTDTLLNVEWQFMRGGYLHIGRFNWTFLHRFRVTGLIPVEKEFVIRAQIALDHEPRFSWYTFEFFNPYEARLCYLWFKLWRTLNFHAVFNFGWRLTRASRDEINRRFLERDRKPIRTLKEQNGTGGRDAKLNRAS